MENIKQYIKEVIQRLSEREYDAPSEIIDVLQNRLEMFPIQRYISHFKSINSIPPSYEVNLHNGEKFIIAYESFSLVAKIGSKDYFLNGDVDEKNYAIKHINRLLTGPKSKPEEEDLEDLEDMGPAKGASKAPKAPPLDLPLPPPPPPPPPGGGEEPEA